MRVLLVCCLMMATLCYGDIFLAIEGSSIVTLTKDLANYNTQPPLTLDLTLGTGRYAGVRRTAPISIGSLIRESGVFSPLPSSLDPHLVLVSRSKAIRVGSETLRSIGLFSPGDEHHMEEQHVELILWIAENDVTPGLLFIPFSFFLLLDFFRRSLFGDNFRS